MSTEESGPSTLAAESRAPGTVRTNRILLALSGLVLAVIGGAALAVSLGLVSGIDEDRRVLDPVTDDFIASHAWFWPVVVAVAAVVALLSLWWLTAQARSNRISALPVSADAADEDGAGRTTLSAGALTDAVAGEVASYRGVGRARAHLSGSPDRPRLTVEVDLDGREELGVLHERIVTGAVAHARQALDTEHLPTRLELQVPKNAARDLR